ncbi:hypothetical protein C1H46_036828 [Malus baccata]|uniref:KOW domain-containing protein n=1 Tax=Malus baccata TaxID=106549 RepID=A0A540KU13_MALBA|nr:hypothetical protein C1H46_036828 [Malus baccata]
MEQQKPREVLATTLYLPPPSSHSPLLSPLPKTPNSQFPFPPLWNQNPPPPPPSNSQPEREGSSGTRGEREKPAPAGKRRWKLLEKPTKKFANWKEELNLNNLAHEGPQWWIIKVSRVKGQETAQLIARQLARNYPHIDFKEIHDFIRECDGVAGSVGSKVGNTKRQITRPRPVSEFDMEAIFKQEKEEQQKAEQAFEQEQQEATLNDAAEFDGDSKPKKRPRKALDPLINGSSKGKSEKLVPGSSVRVVSGTFAEYVGSLKKLNKRTKKAFYRHKKLGLPVPLSHSMFFCSG